MSNEEILSAQDIDTIGEVGNIFMGSASTTLSQLLGNRVEITAPTVEIFENIQESYVAKEDHLIIEVNYTKGLQGTVILALKQKDSAIIADLMMGGNGKIDKPEITELQISAVGEAMNQMVGTASTTLSEMLNTQIKISPPEIKVLEKQKQMELSKDLLTKPIITIKFNLIVGDLIKSEIIQFMSVASAKSQVAEVTDMMKTMSDDLKHGLKSESVVDSLSSPAPSTAHSSPIQSPPPPPMPQAPPPAPMPQSPPPIQAQPQLQPQQQVTVQPVQFSALDKVQNVLGETNRNLNLVMDVQLELTVELGRTELPIKNVLELTRGSIIELNKVAGESVDLYANGKLIAKGEVVVIEDNFGLRITNIISPEQRIQEL
ncbi:MAG: flagellar motor switch protein FliN [Candidatus Melainabacteria bacterium GWF2_37_15]|nr:MAG: flagellar motor switch protein FliN [Candidatus Melainabacteria bacterium GWF2_37_15]